MHALLPLLLAAAQPHDDAQRKVVHDAARAVGCPVPDDVDRSSAAAFAGRGDETVVATLEKSGEDDIGDLCVGMTRRTPKGPVRTATLADGPIPLPDQVAGLSSGHVDVQPGGIGDVRGDALIAVTTGGDYSSTATEVHWTTLHLFHRTGAVLRRVLQVTLADSDHDKNGMGGSGFAGRKVVAAATRHRGGTNLELVDRRGRILRRYRWNGVAYHSGR